MDDFFGVPASKELETLWPLTAPSLIFYVIVAIYWIYYLLIQCRSYRAFWSLRKSPYFRQRHPKLAMVGLHISNISVLIFQPITLFYSLKAMEDNWNYPEIARIVGNAFVFASILIQLIRYWIILFDFQFQLALFKLKTQNKLSYNSTLRGINPKYITNIPEKHHAITVANASISEINNNKTDDKQQQQKQQKESFWLKYKSTFGTSKAGLILFIFFSCIHIISYTISIIYSHNYAGFVQFGFLFIVGFAMLRCGYKISKFRDKLFIRGLLILYMLYSLYQPLHNTQYTKM